MTNREKYHFDDFTLDSYRRLVRLAKKNGFQFILYKDEFVPARKDVIWRHDVEFEPDIALKMAEIEHEEGVSATYFFQLHSTFYNVLDPYYREVVRRIISLGHSVGLHFDSAYWGITNEEQLNKYIVFDKVYIERTFEINIESFSFHNTTSFTLGCTDFRYGGIINVYSSFFKEHFDYCSDSLGYWRYDRLEDTLNDHKVQHLQVLTHDANWSEEVLSPRKRLYKAIYDHSNRLFEGQKSFLHRKGLPFPDDDED